ncbi:MAG: VWA domain-containing protein [Pyrinomonadaceae bacterium]
MKVKTMLRLTTSSTRLFIITALCFISTAAAQPTGTPTSSAPTPPPPSLMKLNVIVTGKEDTSAVDVLREDVVIKEDGAVQAITHFAKEELPVSFALVVDNSGSLRFHINDIIKSGQAIVSVNRPGDEAMLVRFVSSNKIQVVKDFTSAQSELNKGLDSMYIEGGETALIDAVYLSAKRVAERKPEDAQRRRSIILLTDGEDRHSLLKSEELIEYLRRGSVQVFAIAFVKELDIRGSITRKSSRAKATDLITAITRESGGRAFFPDHKDDLINAVNEITRDLRSQYVIGYASSAPARDGKFREVEVKIAAPPGSGKRRAIVRRGYYPPAHTPAPPK